jgi:hypothetical protein
VSAASLVYPDNQRMIRKTYLGRACVGRPEAPLDSDGSALRELAIELRGLRRRAGLTYKQLAKVTSYGTSTLQEAAAGRRLPTLDVTLAIVAACNGDVEAWREYWAQVCGSIGSGVAPEAADAVVPPWRTPTAATQPGVPEPLAVPTPVEAPAAPASLPRPRRSVSTRSALIAAGLTMVIAAGVAAVISGELVDRPAPAPGVQSAPAEVQPSHTYPEEEYNKNGAATFQFLNGSGPGQPLEFQESVLVSCKVRNTTLPSVMPDGYWYRIASMPWDNHYYAVANTFLNGDRPGGPYTHNTDWTVPNC